ncbi:MAG: hypothetical protein ACJAVB_002394, partial [Cyclobacteriaceae bacterium]
GFVGIGVAQVWAFDVKLNIIKVKVTKISCFIFTFLKIQIVYNNSVNTINGVYLPYSLMSVCLF